MPRFVKVTEKNGDIVLLINTDYVVNVKYEDNSGRTPRHSVVIEVAKNKGIEITIIDFESKYAAMDFLEKNFLLFNS